MEIEETKIVGKAGEEKCEDGIVTTNDFIAVVDGSTSKTKFQVKSGEANGKLAMQVICEAVKRLPRRSSIAQIASFMTKAIAKEYKKNKVDESLIAGQPENRLTASMVIYSDYRREIYLLGDCQALIDGKQLLTNPKPYEDKLAEKRANLIKRALAQGMTTDELAVRDIGREAIVGDLIDAMRHGQNKDYIVLDGTKPAMAFAKAFRLGSMHHDIVLASDGYPFLKPTLMDSEGALLLQLYKDPMNINTYKATKGKMKGFNSFDDRAFVRFEI